MKGPQTAEEEKALAAFRARTGGNMDAHCTRILDGIFLAIGAVIMFQFVRFARKVEPFSR